MKIKLRHKIVFKVLKPLLRLYAKIKNGFTTRTIKGNTPCLILCNHTALLDPIWVSITFDHPVYFVAADFIFNKSLGSRLMQYLVSPISITKGKVDVGAIREMKSVLDQNGAVAMFPTANTTYSGSGMYINSATAKLVKMFKVPLVLYRLDGLYGTDPRWAKKPRKGKATGAVVKTLSVEELSQMTNEQLHDEIVATLQPNAEQMVLSNYKSNAKAEYLERALYLCPDCHSLNTMTSHGNTISCSHCHYTAEYTEQLQFNLLQGYHHMQTVSQWFYYQLDYLKTMNFDHYGTNKPIVTDNGTNLYTKQKMQKKKLLQADFTAKLFTNRIELGDTTIMLDDIMSMAVQNRNNAIFYTEKQTYLVQGLPNANYYKYIALAVQLSKTLQERLGYEFLGL